ncbi:hypothetical protein ACVIW0_006280 [Bradyrhizobium sp. USDA 4454]
MALPWLNDQLAAFKPKALDDFSRTTITGAQHALGDFDNPLRLNFFSTAMRILFEHMLGTLAPVEEVVQSQWFVSEREGNVPTRGQRIVFAIQGGLSDAFVRDTLQIDIAAIRKKLIKAVDNLSKHVHGREDTIIEGRDEQDAAASGAIEALGNFLDTYHECRKTLLDAIQDELDDTTVNALMTDTILEVDELATHHSVEEVYVGRDIGTFDRRALHYVPRDGDDRGGSAMGIEFGHEAGRRSRSRFILSFPLRYPSVARRSAQHGLQRDRVRGRCEFVARRHGAGRRRFR